MLGKYVPQLEFLDVLLGGEPPLDARVTFYQRLLARDQDEATIVVGQWGLTVNVETNREQLQDAGADLTATTLLETRSQLTSLLPILEQEQGGPLAGREDLAATEIEGRAAEGDTGPKKGVVHESSQSTPRV